jgi:hypothetical protein
MNLPSFASQYDPVPGIEFREVFPKVDTLSGIVPDTLSNTLVVIPFPIYVIFIDWEINERCDCGQVGCRKWMTAELKHGFGMN